MSSSSLNVDINLIANSKDSEASMSEAYSSIKLIIEQTSKDIIRIISSNYTELLNAVKEANQIEDDIKQMQNLLSEQNKLVLEISTLKQSQLFKTDAPMDDSKTDHSDGTESSLVSEDLIQAKKSIRHLKSLVVERKYDKIKHVIDTIRRNVVNLDAVDQHQFSEQLADILEEHCLSITYQILNTHELLLTDDYSIDKLLAHLVEIEQVEMALDTYLKLASSKINSLFRATNNQNVSFIHYMVKLMSRSLTVLQTTKDYISSKLDYPTSSVKYYFWVEESIKSITNHAVIKAVSQKVIFFEFCECIRSMIEQASILTSELRINLPRAIKSSVASHLSSWLRISIRRFSIDFKNLLKNEAWSGRDLSLLTETQSDFICSYDDASWQSDQEICVAVLYLLCYLNSLMRCCYSICKRSLLASGLEDLLVSVASYLSVSSRDLSDDQIPVFNKNVTAIINKTTFAFEHLGKSSQLTDSQKVLLSKLNSVLLA